jgi:ATP-dependent DNA helicase RecG
MGTDLSAQDIQYVKGVGPKKAQLLGRLGISTVRDVLYYFPFRYEDRSNLAKIMDITPGASRTVMGRVVGSELRDLRQGGRKLFRAAGYRRSGLRLFELSLSDGSGMLRVKWFNQPYLKKLFSEGVEVVLHGTVKQSTWGPPGLEMDNPEFEVLGTGADATVHTARIAPIYRTTEGFSVRQLRTLIYDVLDRFLDGVPDPIPADILAKYGFPGLRDAVMSVHFPPQGADPEALNRWGTPAQQRLSFDELFMVEAGFALVRSGQTRQPGIQFAPAGKLLEKMLESLPFDLTNAQLKAVEDVLKDMKSPWPMNRLLQGDVGSGKTVVALAALISAVECGYQGALMAPTEILAEQHYINIHKLVEDLGVRICLLTGSTKQCTEEDLAGGGVDVVVGTHALIQENVRFRKLGLVVIDEQHRFGVMQRAHLRKKGLSPDVLIMTATPIPRTLALTLYGDLDYSVMDELPPGRTPVETRLFLADQKHAIYESLEEEVASGGQAYIVYPLVEESEKTSLKNAIMGEEALRKIFPSMRIGLVHGRMKPAEKESVMASFKAGEIDVLVSTTVIEVGVDVPNASLMVVVHAERFGLSQLHQLRGRVGRGRRRSRCFLLAYPPISEEGQRRLDAMCATTDGFRIAEEDLEIRGPGEFVGTKQSGLPDLRVANIVRDAQVLESAREEAFKLMEDDPEVTHHPVLRRELEAFWKGKVELFSTG